MWPKKARGLAAWNSGHLFLFDTAIEYYIIFENCVHGLIIYIYSDSIYEKLASVETFRRHGILKNSDILRLMRRVSYDGASPALLR
jgi:hypothetical protein